MSDRPLFPNADEQEAAYAGDAAPTGDASPSVIIPGAAATGGALSGQIGPPSAMGTGMAPAAGPVIGGINRSPAEDRDDDGVIEDQETGQARS